MFPCDFLTDTNKVIRLEIVLCLSSEPLFFIADLLETRSAATEENIDYTLKEESLYLDRCSSEEKEARG